MDEIIVAVCDNSAADVILLQSYLEKAETELGKRLRIFTFQSADDFFKNISPIFDVVFLTTSIPELRLDETVRKLQASNYHCHLILISPGSGSVSVGYEYGAKNHLSRPVSYIAVLNTLQKYIKSASRTDEPFLWVSNRDGHFKLFFSRLRYVETENRHLTFHYEEQVLRQSGRISNCEELLPETWFFRCNNSYIVNLRYIESIVPEGNRYEIHLLTGEVLPLSRSRYRKLLSLLSVL